MIKFNADETAVFFNKIYRQVDIERGLNSETRLHPRDRIFLDRILKSYVEDLLAPEQIAATYGFSADLVRSVALQVDRSEYKRKQAPPGLKVTSKAFSVGRRFPIAQKF